MVLAIGVADMYWILRN